MERMIAYLTDCNALYEALDKFPDLQGGSPLQGWCWVLAQALKIVYKEGELVAVGVFQPPHATPDGNCSGCEEGHVTVVHVALRVRGNYFDGNGGPQTERAFFKTWTEETRAEIGVALFDDVLKLQARRAGISDNPAGVETIVRFMLMKEQ